MPNSNPEIPRLENGDRLTRAEFERRYDAMPRLNKAELIDGVCASSNPESVPCDRWMLTAAGI